MRARASSVGWGNSILRSRRPDLRRAGSKMSTLFVAATTCHHTRFESGTNSLKFLREEARASCESARGFKMGESNRGLNAQKMSETLIRSSLEKPSSWFSNSSIVLWTSLSPESSESKRLVPTASISSMKIIAPLFSDPCFKN